MNDLRVAVIRGGISEEYDISLKTGYAALLALRTKFSDVSDIIISKQGEWLQDGRARAPESILQGIDRVFIALHGRYGEDGEIQKYLQRFSIPFTGSRALASAVAFNKDLTKQSLRDSATDFCLPQHVLVVNGSEEDLVEQLKLINDSFSPPYVLKPNTSGSSLGVRLVSDLQQLTVELKQLLVHYEQVLVEEYIRGREATCAVLEDFRGASVYAFPVVEIIPPKEADFFNMEVKYNGETQEICPGNFSYRERDLIQQAAITVHTKLGLAQYSRSDFIIRNGKVYFLEVNTLPGLTPESLYPKAAAAVGLSLADLVEKLVMTAKI